MKPSTQKIALERMQILIDTAISNSQTNPNRLLECTLEHREIVDSMIARDGDRAADAVRKHIDKLRDSLFTRLSYAT